MTDPSPANVAATAYVGPRAAVYGNSTVSGNARIEDLAWVNSGATVGGNAVVKQNALVQGGANLGGSVVIGGDAEPANACSAGAYLMFVPDRGCDGRTSVPAEADINPAHPLFTDAELALSGTGPTPTVTPTAGPTPTVNPTPTAGPTPTVNPTTVAPTPTVPAGRSCAATYAVTGQWQGGFQGEVTVRAGRASISGWTVSWTFADGQAVSQSWGATVSASGSAVTATNAAYNGSLAAGASTTFGFIGSTGSVNTAPTLSCAAR